MEDINVKTPAEFQDISPIADKDFHNAMSILVEEPMFRQVVRMMLPGYKYSELKHVLLSLNSKHEFQLKIMKPYIEGLLAKTTNGLTNSGRDQLDKDTPYLYITNHRDIVLDPAQLGYILLCEGLPSCEIAIGNNLLIYDWINKLVRLNKSFIVKRNLGRIQTLAAAIQLSGYMHFAVTQKHTSIWLAQREGRCKDSNDRTQESLIKMLTYGNREKSFIESLKELNIAPVAISYEYDPNDYLKAKEFLCKSKNPNWKKSPEDDLISMQTGIMGIKGHVHYSFTPCINEELDKIPEDLDKLLVIRRVCRIIDNAIHANYKIFKTNYIAHDILYDDKQFADQYTDEEREAFTKYLSEQIDKTQGLKLSEFDRFYMYNKMLQMYSNPLTNQLEAQQ
ncbi:MAG: 1-acyl-sn-glycerol-3-phosphate acyltransferase [Muribaculaceae bacterium]|nr:1-acyl-sn-glycerol-3-phosphate acyltransferase [Muribaculaceae bacterium]MBR3100472.1 1-acyl-sn-glycerol-3-phosphate acyltransferase [Muribaculaceae bacterium]